MFGPEKKNKMPPKEKEPAPIKKRYSTTGLDINRKDVQEVFVDERSKFHGVTRS